MTLYILNESRSSRAAGDLGIYRNLDELSKDIEPIDVENEEFFLFDTDGQFYSIEGTGQPDQFNFRRTHKDQTVAQQVIEDYLTQLDKTYSVELSLEENVRKIDEKA